MKLLITSLVALSAITAKARIHETIAECKARYGAPLVEKVAEKPAEKLLLFQMGVYRLGIYFVNDKAVQVVTKRTDGKELDMKAVMEILKANQEGSEFKMKLGASGEKDVKQISWVRADDKALADAASDGTNSVLIITDMQFQKDKKTAEKKSESTSGF